MPTNVELFTAIDAAITDKTSAASITPENVGEAIKSAISYTDQEIANIPEGPAGPQGVQGIQGVPGPVGPAGLKWRGAWAAATTYAVNDAIGYNGASYFCVVAITGNSGNANPVSDTTHWALLAAQGAQGQTGAQGPQGPQGPPGTSGSSAVYKAKLTQTGGGGVVANVLYNSLSVTPTYTTQSGSGNYGVTMGEDFENTYTMRVSNYSPTKNVKCDPEISWIGNFKQFDLSGNSVANFDDVYIEIRPLNA